MPVNSQTTFWKQQAFQTHKAQGYTGTKVFSKDPNSAGLTSKTHQEQSVGERSRLVMTDHKQMI